MKNRTAIQVKLWPFHNMNRSTTIERVKIVKTHYKSANSVVHTSSCALREDYGQHNRPPQYTIGEDV